MKLTPEKIAELKTMAEHAKSHYCIELAEAFVSSVPDLIADLEEVQSTVAALAPDALREAEERKNIAAGLEVVWQGRMRDAETAHQAELATARKKLAESERRYSESVGGFKRDLQQKLDDQRSKNIRLKAKLAEAQSRDGSTAPVAAIKFSLKTDCGDQFLRCWVEGNFDAIRSEWPKAPEAVFIGADPLHPNTQQTSTAALDAAIAEAVKPYRKDAELWSEHVETLKASVGIDGINVRVSAQRNDGSIYAIHHAIRPFEYINDEAVAERVGQRLSREILAAIAAKGESE